MPRNLEQHLSDPRVQALPGAGWRRNPRYPESADTCRIETLLKTRYGRGDEFRLCDYFDLIGGRSTGAIIATGLALTSKELDRLHEMDEPKNMGLLTRIGKAAARQVDKTHFPAAFDLAQP